MNWLTGIPLIGDVVKTVFGSRFERDAQAHTEQMAIHNQFAQEFGHSKTWWDSFVDGLNRLPRPVMTFGVIWLFYYCVSDPSGFERSAQALTAMPYEGWVALWMIIGFWFGTKAVEKLPKGFGKLNKVAKHVPLSQPQKDVTVLSNGDVIEWNDQIKKRHSDYDNLNN